MKRASSVLVFTGFVLTVVGANWALEKYGIVSIGFGLTAPAGVYFAGLAFGLRDALHELAGKWMVIAAILAGAVISWIISDGVKIPGGVTSIAVASGLAFLWSELSDLVVYSPLREHNWPMGVILSNIVGAIVDSALFLWLAFGSLDHMTGQVVGKTYMVLLAVPLVWLVKRTITHREPACV